MPAILDTLANEPIAVVAVIDALLGLAIGFGAPVDPKIAALIDAAVIAVLALLRKEQGHTERQGCPVRPEYRRARTGATHPARGISE